MLRILFYRFFQFHGMLSGKRNAHTYLPSEADSQRSAFCNTSFKLVYITFLFKIHSWKTKKTKTLNTAMIILQLCRLNGMEVLPLDLFSQLHQVFLMSTYLF